MRSMVEGARRQRSASGKPPPSAAYSVCHLPVPGRNLTYSSQPVGVMYGWTMPIASISCIWPPQTL